MSTFLIISLQSSTLPPSFNPKEHNTRPSSSTDITPSLSLSKTSKASFKSPSPPSPSPSFSSSPP
ncbi:hypothetical protein OIU78_024207 [Salix suchowensis]|nr:hypothetical protein OIU78_024207 [Salix suchowensis]